MKKIKPISLVLGGGGARGFFHLGVLKALKEFDIPIKEISGCSIGALIGTIYADNPEIDLDQFINHVDFRKLLSVSYKGTGLIQHKKIEEYLKKIVKARSFSQLKIPLKFNAVDINTGEEIIFKEGRLFPAVIASMSIPGLFPVVKMKGRFLVDGGLKNNLPISAIDSKKRIVISDLSFSKNKIDLKSKKTEVLKNVYYFLRQENIMRELEKVKNNKQVIYLKFDEYMNVLDFRKSKIEHAFEKGYKMMKEKIKSEKWIFE